MNLNSPGKPGTRRVQSHEPVVEAQGDDTTGTYGNRWRIQEGGQQGPEILAQCGGRGVLGVRSLRDRVRRAMVFRGCLNPRLLADIPPG
jgi:hypothetical protein